MTGAPTMMLCPTCCGYRAVGHQCILPGLPGNPMPNGFFHHPRYQNEKR